MKYNKWIKRFCVMAIAGSMLLSCMPLPYYAALENNAGQTAEQPVIPTDAIYVSTAEDILALAEKCIDDDWSVGKTIVLSNDIDMTGVEFYGIPTFGGSFHGQGYTIRGIHMEQSGSIVGVFRYTQQTAVIDNVKIEAIIQPEGTSKIVGGIVGSNAGTIKNCTFTGIISGKEQIGGIAGLNKAASMIENCTINGVVYGNHYIGGIVGENNGVIRQCTNMAEINSNVEHNSIGFDLNMDMNSLTSSESIDTATNIGGIAGTSTGVIRECYNKENVGYKKMGYNVGGIVGSQNGYVADCINYAKVEGSDGVGGIVGQFRPYMILEFGEDPMDTMTNKTDALTSSVETLSNSFEDIGAEFEDIGAELEAIGAELETIGTEFEDDSIDVDEEFDNIRETIGNLKETLNDLKDVADKLGKLEDSMDSETGEFDRDILESILNDFRNSFDDARDEIEDEAEKLENSNVSSSMREQIEELEDQLNQMEDKVDKVENLMKQIEAVMDRVETAMDRMEDLKVRMEGMESQVEDVMNQMDNLMSSMESTSVEMSIDDVSRYDQENDTIGKVANCTNYGEVAGENAVAGIAGNCNSEMLISEEDIETKGEATVNMIGRIRLVVRGCKNYGTITASKDYTGGIAGHMVQGAILSCYNIGNMDALAADYVGGIAGNCDTFISNCYSKSILAGANYVGGIAGRGVEVLNCYSFVDIAAGTEFVGSILGSADELPGSDDSNISQNYYYHVGKDRGGIDGVNYKGATERISLDDYLGLEKLDDMFKTVTVRFVAEGQEDVVKTVNVGDSIALSEIPALTVAEGDMYDWVFVKSVTSETLGMNEEEEIFYISEQRLSNILFDQTYEAEFEAKYMVCQGEEKTEDNHPIILAVGAFDKNTSIKLTDMLGQDPVVNDWTVKKNFSVSISNIGVEKLHYRIPEDMDADRIVLLVKGSDGKWAEREYVVEGSYMVFEFVDGEAGFALAETADSGWGIIIAVVAIVAVAAILILLKKKQTVVKKEKKN